MITDEIVLERHELTDDDVWTFICAGCNAHEIATWAGVTTSAAHAMMAHATRLYAHPQRAAA